MKAKSCLNCWIWAHPKKNDAESLFGLIDDALKKELNWNNSVAIGMDNTSVSSIVIEVIETVPFFKKKKDFYTKRKISQYA